MKYTIFVIILFTNNDGGETPQQLFTQNSLNDMDSCKDVPKPPKSGPFLSYFAFIMCDLNSNFKYILENKQKFLGVTYLGYARRHLSKCYN